MVEVRDKIIALGIMLVVLARRSEKDLLYEDS